MTDTTSGAPATGSQSLLRRIGAAVLAALAMPVRAVAARLKRIDYSKADDVALEMLAAERRSFAEIWRNRLVWPALILMLAGAYVGGHTVASWGVRGLRHEIGALRNDLATAKEEAGKAGAAKRDLDGRLAAAERARDEWKGKAEAKLAAAVAPPAATKARGRK